MTSNLKNKFATKVFSCRPESPWTKLTVAIDSYIFFDEKTVKLQAKFACSFWGTQGETNKEY